MRHRFGSKYQKASHLYFKYIKSTLAYIFLCAALMANTTTAAIAHELPDDDHFIDLSKPGWLYTIYKINPWKVFLDLAISPAYAFSNRVSIDIKGPFRLINSNGIPAHLTGQFPNPGNPNTISEQSYHFRVPASPKISGFITPLQMQPFGVAINGVPFDPKANEYWQGNAFSGWQYEAMYLGPRLGLDENNAHVQPNGAYHYHGLPTGLVRQLSSVGKPVMLGYAADGFPVYGPFSYVDAMDDKSGIKQLRSSYKLKSGERPNGPGGFYDGAFVQDYEYIKGLGDLDECNGRSGITPEYPEGTYYYVITENYPYIPRYFKGFPDPSFARGPHRPPPGRFFPGGPRPF